MNTTGRPQPFTTNLGESFVRIGCALAGGHPETIAKSVLAHVEMHTVLVNKMVEMMDDEYLASCRMPKDTEETLPFRKMTFDQFFFFFFCL